MVSIQSADQYANGPVPADIIVSGGRIALVEIGIMVALPGLVMGARLGFDHGLPGTAAIVAGGGIILMALAMLTGTVAARSRLSTAQIIRFAFGSLGGRIVGGVLTLTLLGWFGVTAQIFGESVAGIIGTLGGPRLSPIPFILAGGTLMVATTIRGLGALQRLSGIAVPMLLVVLVGLVAMSLWTAPAATLLARPTGMPDLGIGISAVVGGMIVGVTLFPDLCRFAGSAGEARKGAGMAFGFLPLVLLLAAIPAVATGEEDLIAIMTRLGLGIPALVFLVFKSWTTNAGNLYSAALGLSTVLGRSGHATITLIAGSAGVAVAALGIGTQLIPFLLVLGIAIPPIAGIYLADFFLLRGRLYDPATLETQPPLSVPAFAAWAAAIAVGAGSSAGWLALTGIPAGDALLVSFLAYWALSRLMPPLSKAGSQRRNAT